MRLPTLKFLIPFILIELILCSYHIARFWNPNPMSRALPVMTFVKDGTFSMDNYVWSTDNIFVNGHYYSEKAPLPIAIMIPIWWSLTKVFPSLLEKDANFQLFQVLKLGGFLFGALPFVAILLIFFLQLSPLLGDAKAAILTHLTLYSTFIFLYGGVFMGHVFAGLLLLLSYIHLLKSRFLLSGLFVGLAASTEYPVGMAAIVWLPLIFLNQKRKGNAWESGFQFCAGCIPGILLIGLHNWVITGNLLTMPYKYQIQTTFLAMRVNYGLSFPKYDALWGLTFGTYRGLFIFAPVLLVFLAYYLKGLMRKKPGLDSWLLWLSPCAVLFFAGYFIWWGGSTYGPRHLTPFAVLWLFEGLRLQVWKSKKWKWTFYGAVGVGLLLTLSAKVTTGYIVDQFTPYPISQMIIPQILRGEFRGFDIPTLWLGLPPWVGGYGYFLLFACATLALRKSYAK